MPSTYPGSLFFLLSRDAGEGKPSSRRALHAGVAHRVRRTGYRGRIGHRRALRFIDGDDANGSIKQDTLDLLIALGESRVYLGDESVPGLRASDMAADLSLHHEPISPLFSPPATPETWDRYKLTDEQVAFYHEQGYLSGIRVLSDEQVDALRTELNEFFKNL